MSDNSFHCDSCLKVFSSRPSLMQHVHRNHRAVNLHCRQCNFQTKFKFGMSRHMAMLHSSNQDSSLSKKSPSPTVRCPMCSFQCVYRKDMIAHYTSEHDIAINQQQLEFEDIHQFLRWKEEFEGAENCHFISHTGPRNRQRGIVHYYKCSRDGVFHTRSTGKRRMKEKGSIKINCVCPASIVAIVDKATDAVSSTVVHTHVGHPQELGHNLEDVHHCVNAWLENGQIVLQNEEEEVKNIVNVEHLQQDTLTLEKDLNEKKLKLRLKFEELLEKVQCDEHIAVLWDALLPVGATIDPQSTPQQYVVNEGKIRKTTLQQHVSPQNTCFSEIIKINNEGKATSLSETLVVGQLLLTGDLNFLV